MATFAPIPQDLPSKGVTRETLIQVFKILVLMTINLLIGAAGFYTIEGWSFFDALYMAMITLTTVGFSEVHPLSHGGRVFVMIYMVSGLWVTFYGLATLGEIMIKTQVLSWLGSRRMDSEIKNMKDHFIICGYGRMGQSLAKRLRAEGISIVAIDHNAEHLKDSRRDNIHTIVGDAADDKTLEMAGIDRARGVAALLGADADNLYVVISSRIMNPRLHIIARASSDAGIIKLGKAGADHVVSPYSAGASKMAEYLLGTQGKV